MNRGCGYTILPELLGQLVGAVFCPCKHQHLLPLLLPDLLRQQLSLAMLVHWIDNLADEIYSGVLRRYLNLGWLVHELGGQRLYLPRERCGEQQRLALARAWLLNPRVLFLDEPTSALDPAAIKAVEDAVLEFHHSGTRIVMTTHDLHQARRLANDVLFLHNGELLEHTPANDFFTAPYSPEAGAFIRGELVW